MLSRLHHLAVAVGILALGACSGNGSSRSGPSGSPGGSLSDAESIEASEASAVPPTDGGDSAASLLDSGAANPGMSNPAGALSEASTSGSADGGPDSSVGSMSGQGGGADASPASGESGTSTVACDRACLLGILQKYLDALAARDLTRIAVSTGVKYTENGTVLNLGDGLWKTASMIDPMERLDFADPPQGQVASQVVVYENGSSPVIYQVRLRVVNGEITEIEAMAVRQQDAANGFFDPANMKPQPVFLATIDPASRMTRDQLKTVVDLYIDYLDGMTNASGVPFDANCARYENGVETATPGSFATQAWSFNVVRRYLVFDEEAGIAWGLFPFTPDANTLVVGEAFKVMSGNIMMIQAVMANMPANAWN